MLEALPTEACVTSHHWSREERREFLLLKVKRTAC